MKMKSQKLNIYRIKDSISQLSEITKKDTLSPYEFETEKIDGSIKYTLYVSRNDPRTPKWYGLIEPLLDKSKPDILSRAASFILFIEFGNNIYALTGGYGHTKIKDYIDDEFGLHMALRMIEPHTITSITQKAMKGATRQIYRAVVGYRPDLDLENRNRVLQAIKGKTADETFGITISGKASLSFRTKMPFVRFKELFEKIEIVYESKPLTDFPRSYKIIKDKEIKAELNKLLVAEFNAFIHQDIDRDRLYLELGDLYEQFRCTDFKIKYSGVDCELAYFNLESIRDILREIGKKEFEDIKELAKIKITGLDEEGYSVFEETSIVKLLICEVDNKKSSFIYLHQKWYQIYDDLKKYVDSEIKNIKKVADLMPVWDKALLPDPKGEKEYNLYVGGQKGWAVLDCDFVKTKDSTFIEVCDLFNKDEIQFIHVKKTWGSKASYLFTQGLVSAVLNHGSEDFRKESKKKWPDLFDGQFNGGQVIYAIADNKALLDEFPNNLTYFSKISLMHIVADLRGMGYEVALAPVEMRG